MPYDIENRMVIDSEWSQIEKDLEKQEDMEDKTNGTDNIDS